MRGARRRGQWCGRTLPVLALLLTAACSTAACSNEVVGSAVGADIAPPTATETVAQSLVDFGETGVVRYQGTMVSAADDKVVFDVAAAATGEVFGSLSLDGKAATVLVVDKTIYLKAAADFWAALSGVSAGGGRGTAVADRWVKVPGGLIGIEVGDVFAPDVLSRDLARGLEKAGTRPLADGKRMMVGQTSTVQVSTEGGTVFLNEQAPYGVVRVDLDRVGSSDATSVSQFVAQVSDGSTEIAKFYQDVAAQAGQLTAPVDVLTTVQEGGHDFADCGAASCAIVVQFTNTSKVAVTVSVRGNWLGDSAPLGACEAKAGPVAPGQPGSATCVLATPQWVEFFRRANSVPGNHPYSVEWSTVVLADAPDLTRLTARAAAAPADPKDRKTEGSHYLYALGYTDNDRKQRVWKYGVVAGKFWQDHAGQQLRTCLATTGSVCRVELVTATGDAAPAHGLLRAMVETYRGGSGQCPSGQWVSCKR
ncbi:hypothetical protein [Actinokineospora sp.]|uniref:hypothetical protein n=1 Tax=Actinokineospora sp. TaxID=1872133 RepID=UPI0040383E75